MFDSASRLAPMVLALVMFAATPAQAKIYVDFSAGFPASGDPESLLDDTTGGTDFEFDLDTNSAFSLALGIDGGLVRSEIEATFRDTEGILLNTDPPSADAGSGSFENISLMQNLYLDIPIPATPFEVFVGGGAGLVIFDGSGSSTDNLDLDVFDDAGFGFAYQFKAGVAWHLTGNVALTAGYRFWRASEIDFDAFELDEAEVQSVDVGLRLSF